MRAPSFLRRHLRFASFVWLTLGAGLAIGIAAALLLRLDRVWPIGLHNGVRPTAIPDTTWVTPWTPNAWTAAQTQQTGANALTGVLLALAAAATLMALINVLTLASARAIASRRERAVRAAVGAGPVQFLARRVRENAIIYGGALVLAACGSALLLEALKATWPAGLDPLDPARRSAAFVFLAAFGAAVAATVLRRGPRDLRGILAGGSATDDRSAGIGRGATVVIEVALAMALASVTVLLLRYGRSTAGMSVSSGDDMVTLELASTLTDPGARADAYRLLLDRVHEMPGVRAESLASPGAWLGMGTRDRVMYECTGCVRAQMVMPIVPAYPVHHSVSPGFFDAFGIRLIAGRVFERSDVWDTTRVAIINEAFAARGFGQGGPLGKKVQIGGPDGDWFTIVGIVANAPVRGLGAPREDSPALYLSTFQQPPAIIGVAALTDAAPESFAGSIEALDGVAPAEVRDPAPLSERYQRALAPLQWFGRLFAVLAAAALAFAIHGVLVAVRTAMAARRRELAIRAAVGAGPARILGFVLGRTARTVATGIGLGAVLGGLASRTIQLQIGGLPPIDLEAALPIAGIIALAALAGALGPAARAAVASPARVFRE